MPEHHCEREMIPIMAGRPTRGVWHCKAVFLTLRAEKQKEGDADSNVGGFKHIYLFSHIHGSVENAL